MAYDPKEPRDKGGKWSGTNSASGHNAGKGNRVVAAHIKLQHIPSENDALTALALKHDPEGYARMKAIKSIRDAIYKHQHQRGGLHKGDPAMPKGYIDATGFHPEVTDPALRMNKIQNLINRPGTAGEKQAAKAALKRMKKK